MTTKKKSTKKTNYKLRRVIGVSATVAVAAGGILANPASYETVYTPVETPSAESENAAPLGASSTKTAAPLAADILEQLPVKGRASKTNYDREQFYKSWPTIDGCNLRQRIIKRDLGDTAVIDTTDNCSVISGEFDEPYTGSHLVFYQKSDFTTGVQIDHVVALSDAWQKGAQNLSSEERYNLATDPLNLLAVDAKTNQQKSDGDAATWLPPNKKFRCAYVARQISVKYKYSLWVSTAEKSAIKQVLSSCPHERTVGLSDNAQATAER